MTAPDTAATAGVRGTATVPDPPPGGDARDRGTLGLSVRDEVFLMAHDGNLHDQARLLLNERSLGLGLAGALLADLALAGVLVVAPAWVSVRRDAPPTGELTAAGWRRLTEHGQSLPLSTALGLLAVGLVERTRASLIVSGRLRQVHRRWRRQPRLLLADAYLHVRVRARCRDAVTGADLSHGRRPDPITHSTCVLIDALGLHDQMFFDQPVAEVRAALGQTIARVPEHFAGSTLAGLTHIGMATKAAVGDAATSPYG